MPIANISRIDPVSYDWTGSIYENWGIGGGARGADVFAPADGAVLSVTSSAAPGGGLRLDVTGAGGIRYYIDGLGDAVVAAGASLTAGQLVGHQGGLTGRYANFPAGIRLGVIHPSRTVGFINPDRFPEEVARSQSPAEYLAEPVRTQLLGKMAPQRTDTALSFDVPGRLQGMWFQPDVPRSESLAHDRRTQRIFFWRSIENMGVLRVSVPFYTYTHLADVTADQPDPAGVSPQSGIVTYRFPYSSENAVILLVQMLDGQTIKAETFDSYYVKDPVFTSAAKTYVR
jgi:hypothetical protein